MKKFMFVILCFTITLCAFSYFDKLHFREGFMKGFSEGSSIDEKCVGESKRYIFYEYYKACDKVCDYLYKEKLVCVSKISGGAITCVCKQH